MYSRDVADDPALDYPAAHSMDTSWFAIDNDGHVAVFDTGESGCVPEDAYVGDDAYSFQEQIRALPMTGFKFDPQGYRESQWQDHMADDADLDPDTELYMFVSDLVPVQDLLSRLEPEEMAATTCKAYKLRARDRAALAELHARQACLGCYRDWGGSSEEIAAHGVYRYEHTCENWIAGPYARAVVPANPLTIDQIPKDIRDKAIAFDGRFADTPKLQPAEHWECTSWEPGWLSSDGKTARPFPDHEDSWDDFAGDRGDIEAGDGAIKFESEPLELDKEPKPRWWK